MDARFISLTQMYMYIIMLFSLWLSIHSIAVEGGAMGPLNSSSAEFAAHQTRTEKFVIGARLDVYKCAEDVKVGVFI